MSDPEGRAARVPAAEVVLRTSTAAILELAALRGREPALRELAVGRGFHLPDFGRSSWSGAGLALCVRPSRWLLLQPASGELAGASGWEVASQASGTVVELSSALAILYLQGPAAPDVLARSCRLDLRAADFGAGSAAATLIAQVATIIVAVPRGFLLMTPSSTARHFREWLLATGRPFGMGPPGDVPFAELARGN